MIQAILTDIEGTTSSLSFVKDVLFPYARDRMANFVRSRANDPEIREVIAHVERFAGGHLPEDGVIDQLRRWMDEDAKVTPLKTLQGMIWREGYERGELGSHVYPDAVKRLKEWKARGISLYVFSSGSIQAQKLLFGHTEHGDLTSLFSGYFDTTIGSKKSPDSYRLIAEKIGASPGNILFLSDLVGELDAARVAGFQTTCLVREGSKDPEARHRQETSFDALAL